MTNVTEYLSLKKIPYVKYETVSLQAIEPCVKRELQFHLFLFFDLDTGH